MAQHYTDAQLADVANLVGDRPPTLGRSRLVALDGPAGSGKTSLASQLHRWLARDGRAVDVVHLDDLYGGWSGLDAAGDLEQRVLDQVLRPLARAQPARWQRYDWPTERWAEWHDLIPPDVLIVEGCGSGALAYASYVTLLVWVEAVRATRLARAVERDGDQVLPFWLRWMDAEERHFAANGTPQRADLRLRTG